MKNHRRRLFGTSPQNHGNQMQKLILGQARNLTMLGRLVNKFPSTVEIIPQRLE